VQARARHGTDWYLARDQLGEEGQDPDRIGRFAERMDDSRAHAPSVAYRATGHPEWDPTLDPLCMNEEIPHMGWLNPKPERETPDINVEFGLCAKRVTGTVPDERLTTCAALVMHDLIPRRAPLAMPSQHQLYTGPR